MGLWVRPAAHQITAWAVRAAAHAASSPSGAGRDRVGEKRGTLPPPGVSPKPRDGEAWSPFVLLRGGGGGAVVLSPGAQSDRMFFGRPAGVGSRLALCMGFVCGSLPCKGWSRREAVYITYMHAHAHGRTHTCMLTRHGCGRTHTHLRLVRRALRSPTRPADLPRRQHERFERPQRLEREDVGGSSRSPCAISGSTWCGS